MNKPNVLSNANLDFDEISHTYTAGGVILPSVTTLVRWKLGNSYQGVPDETLEQAGRYGNAVHSIIEQYLTKRKVDIDSSIYAIEGDSTEFIDLIIAKLNTARNAPKVEIESTEQHITNGRIAGTYDMRTKEGELIDIKTTYHFDRPYLEYQIGLYNHILESNKEGWCLYIPKRRKTAEWYRIKPKTSFQCELLIEEYEEQAK